MAKSTKSPEARLNREPTFGAFGFIALIAIACIVMVGCAHKPTEPGVQTKSEAEIALLEVKEEWLKKCDTELPDRNNSVESLLADTTDSMALLAVCSARHNSFVDYLGGLVRKLKGQK